MEISRAGTAPHSPQRRLQLKHHIISAIFLLRETAVSRLPMQQYRRFGTIGEWRLTTVFGTKRCKKTRSKRNTELRSESGEGCAGWQWRCSAVANRKVFRNWLITSRIAPKAWLLHWSRQFFYEKTVEPVDIITILLHLSLCIRMERNISAVIFDECKPLFYCHTKIKGTEHQYMDSITTFHFFEPCYLLSLYYYTSTFLYVQKITPRVQLFICHCQKNFFTSPLPEDSS